MYTYLGNPLSIYKDCNTSNFELISGHRLWSLAVRTKKPDEFSLDHLPTIHWIKRASVETGGGKTPHGIVKIL